MRAIILTEGSSKKGFGHIERCKGIYDMLMMYGHTPYFLIDSDNEPICILEGYNYDFINFSDTDFSNYKNSYCIVDSYHLNDNLIDKITSNFYKTLFIDDLNLIEYKNCTVVNPSIYGTSLNYPKKDDVTYLIGEKYVMLREPFWQDFYREIKKEIKTITITIGGTDILNISHIIIEEITKISGITLNVIVSSGFSDDNIKNIEKYENINIYRDLDASEMRDLFLETDLCISASGQTVFELVQTRTVSVFIKVIDNQKYNQKYILENHLGETIEPLDITHSLLNKINEMTYKKRKDIYDNLSKISFKDGVKNICEAFIDKIVFRKATIDDINLLFNWTNDSDVRKNSFNSEPVLFETHEKWFKNVLDDENTNIYIASLNGKEVGQVRVKIEDDYGKIGYSVDKDYRGFGIGYLMLKELYDYLYSNDNKITLVGEVKYENIASIKVFEKLLYEKIDNGTNYVFKK